MEEEINTEKSRIAKIKHSLDILLDGLLVVADKQRIEEANYVLYKDPLKYQWWGIYTDLDGSKFHYLMKIDSEGYLHATYYDKDEEEWKTSKLVKARKKEP